MGFHMKHPPNTPLSNEICVRQFEDDIRPGSVQNVTFPVQILVKACPGLPRKRTRQKAVFLWPRF
jgi:hypothetical protein